MLRRANKTRMALGGEPGTAHWIAPKPKGIWQRSYQRKRWEVEHVAVRAVTRTSGALALTVQPAALFTGVAEHFAQSCPDAKRAIADGQIRGMGKATPLEIKEQFTPALRAFAVAVRQAQDFLAAPLVRVDQHQNALFVVHSEDQIAELRERRAAGTLIKDLMAHYSLSKATIYRYLGATEM